MRQGKGNRVDTAESMDNFELRRVGANRLLMSEDEEWFNYPEKSRSRNPDRSGVNTPWLGGPTLLMETGSKRGTSESDKKLVTPEIHSPLQILPPDRRFQQKLPSEMQAVKEEAELAKEERSVSARSNQNTEKLVERFATFTEDNSEWNGKTFAAVD